MKKIHNIIFIAVLALGCVLLFGFANNKQKQNNCKSVNIIINKQHTQLFINKSDIRQFISNYYIDNLIGHPITKINFEYLEEIVEKNPFISNAEVFSSILGELSIEVYQKEPIVKVINSIGVNYYIDKKGFRIPLSDKFTHRVVIASGNIYDRNYRQDTITSVLLNQLYKIAKYINADEFWKSQIEQIYINENKEFELVPRIDNHIILLGDADKLDEKFNKLMLFYKESLHVLGWNKYKVINLKYKDQIICKKN